MQQQCENKTQQNSLGERSEQSSGAVRCYKQATSRRGTLVIICGKLHREGGRNQPVEVGGREEGEGGGQRGSVGVVTD